MTLDFSMTLTRYAHSDPSPELEGELLKRQEQLRPGQINKLPRLVRGVPRKRTFMGRLSMSSPFNFVSASLALPGKPKMIVAIPRLTPLGPYVMVTRLTGPTDLPKYS